jgi:hypothetical protein
MDASYNSTINAYSVNGVVGANTESCKVLHTKSNRYVVTIAPRPPIVPKGSGYGISNFGDGCKQPMAGQPITLSMLTNH